MYIYIYIYTVSIVCAIIDLDEELNVTHLNEVITKLKQAHHGSANWEGLGLHLGLLEPRLREIEKEEQSKPNPCLRKVLTDWLQQNYENVEEKGVPTWNTLADAVKSLGNPKAAEDIICAITGTSTGSL